MSERSTTNYEPRTANSIMLQGTASHVGKSILVAALCRIFREEGMKVAPFKAQNMALNSFATLDGKEIGRAQAFQAEAAGILPSVDMNPILLKPTSDMGSQVIVHGRVYGNMKAQEYHRFKQSARQYVLESYTRLSQEYDVIVIEGAGSPAEINLRENDIVNMGMAEMVDAPVLLVGDIDKGGVFASFVGTMELLSPREKKRVKGFIINKFRGDIELLKPGIDAIEQKTGVPVIGVVPSISNIQLPDEDGVVLETGQGSWVMGRERINLAVIKLPRISNFTDFDPFKFEPDVNVRYVQEPSQLDGADVIMIPGTKNTLEDIAWLRSSGIADRIIQFKKEGRKVVGICGGFQMLGKRVKDQDGVESYLSEIQGIGLLDVETILRREKKTYQIEGTTGSGVMGHGLGVQGYEIHMGETIGAGRSFAQITKRSGLSVSIEDGAISEDGRIWGTYIHGIFDNDELRTWFLNSIRTEKGLSTQGAIAFKLEKNANIKRLAQVVRESLDVQKVYEIIGQTNLKY